MTSPITPPITSPIHQAIADKLTKALGAEHIGMIDNSHYHVGHAGNTGHHLVITIVSPQFEGKNTLARHRMVHAVLKEEMQSTIHALELRLFNTAEWAAQ